MFIKRKNKIFEKNIRRKDAMSLVSIMQPNSRVGEQFRSLRTNIQLSMTEKDLQTMMFTSSSSTEGKSTIVSNIATVFATQGLKVLIVDADMRFPSIARNFQVDDRLGLSTLLTSQDLNITDVIQSIKAAHLDILPSGIVPQNPSELLHSNRMNEIIEALKQMYDLIIFDTPPITAVTDAQILATKVEGTVLVIRRDVAYIENVYKAKELLDRVDTNIIGAIYNGALRERNNSYTYSSYAK